MKWLNNLDHLSEHGTVGSCPNCKSNNTHYGYESTKKGKSGYGAVWCSDCNHGMYISRVDMTKVSNLGETIPQNLIQ